MNNTLLHSYAQLILKSGLNLKQGQNLVINSEHAAYDFMIIIAEEAYKMGAQFVKLDINSPRLLKSRLLFSQEKYLDFIPSYLIKDLQSFLDENWAWLSLRAPEDLDILADVDKNKLTKVTRAVAQSTEFFNKALSSSKNVWCVAAYPTPGWAGKVFSSESSSEAQEKLWELMVPILYLDKKNPIDEWNKHTQRIHERCNKLNAYNLSYLHFIGPETDLKIHLITTSFDGKKISSKWLGGSGKTISGHFFSPNIPSEEIFTTPDLSKTEGTAACTRPVTILNNQVENVRFTFKNGKVTSYSASKGEETLKNFLNIDDQAAQLGEVALVDSNSPIYRSNTIFHNILFDENAACHFALGRGYLDAIENSASLSDNDLKAIGCNTSLVHTDFMIGSDKTSVYGHDNRGNKITIIENGIFKI